MGVTFVTGHVPYQYFVINSPFGLQKFNRDAYLQLSIIRQWQQQSQTFLLINHATLKPAFSNPRKLSGFCDLIFIDNKLKTPNLHTVNIKIHGKQFSNLCMVAIETSKEMPPPHFLKSHSNLLVSFYKFRTRDFITVQRSHGFFYALLASN